MKSAFAFAPGEKRPRQFWRIYEAGQVEVGEGLELVEADRVVDETDPIDCYIRDEAGKLSVTDVKASSLAKEEAVEKIDTEAALAAFDAATTILGLKAAIRPLLFGAK